MDASKASDEMVELPLWVPEFVQEFWVFLNSWPLVAALIIVGFFLILAMFARFSMKRIAKRLAAKTKSDVDDRLVSILRKPIFVTILFIGLNAATLSLGLMDSVESITLKLLNSILILVWAGAGFKGSGLLLEVLGREGRFNVIQARTIPLFEITSKILVFAIGGYILLKAWGVDATAWLASAGVLGIALGFAAKDTLANLFSGFFIVADAPYKIGDYIVLETGERGRVTNVGIRSTRVLTRDDVEITLPNAMIANGKIINESGGPSKTRLKIAVGVAYGSDVDQVCELIKQVAVDNDDVCATPAPRVHMYAFGASSLDFNLKCWIKQPQIKGRVTHDLHMAIYKMCERENIEIPYAKRDIYIKEMPKSA